MNISQLLDRCRFRLAAALQLKALNDGAGITPGWLVGIIASVKIGDRVERFRAWRLGLEIPRLRRRVRKLAEEQLWEHQRELAVLHVAANCARVGLTPVDEIDAQLLIRGHLDAINDLTRLISLVSSEEVSS